MLGLSEVRTVMHHQADGLFRLCCSARGNGTDEPDRGLPRAGNVDGDDDNADRTNAGKMPHVNPVHATHYAEALRLPALGPHLAVDVCIQRHGRLET
jgi:hypothetical protein